MKPYIIFALWAFVGWDVGAWAEAYVGIPSFVGVVAGVAIGAAFAVQAQQRMAAAHGAAQAGQVASFDATTTLDRAA